MLRFLISLLIVCSIWLSCRKYVT